MPVLAEYVPGLLQHVAHFHTLHLQVRRQMLCEHARKLPYSAGRGVAAEAQTGEQQLQSRVFLEWLLRR